MSNGHNCKIARLLCSTFSSKITGFTPKKGLVGYSGLTGESSGAGLGERRMPPVSEHIERNEVKSGI